MNNEIIENINGGNSGIEEEELSEGESSGPVPDTADTFEADSLSRRIPAGVKQRMPIYYRYLRTLVANDLMRVSSKGLARMLGVTPSLLRQDLCHFGGFGQQGYGYNVKQLYSAIGEVLGINDEFSAVIVGTGQLADAVSYMPMFTRHGVRLAERFRSVEMFREYCDSRNEEKPAADIAVLVLEEPYNAARMAETAGFKAVVNYSDKDLEERLFPSLRISNVSLADPVMAVCCSLKHERE